jgi:CheY-like chemotaxis protein
MYRVLVVDDDPSLREMLAVILTGEGYDVACAGNGAEAVTCFERSWQPDVLLLDLLMPVMDGADVCRWLAAHLPSDERPRVLILSASLTPNTQLPVVDALLSKPFNLDRVLTLVRRFCAGIPLHQRLNLPLPISA